MRRAWLLAVPVLPVVLWAIWPRTETPNPTTTSGEAEAPPKSAPSLEPAVVVTAIPKPASPEGARTLPFGDRGLGRGKTADGRPIAPASFVATGEGIVVLDQENQRIALPDGTSVPLPGKHADDIAATKDGFAVLDREGGKSVTLLDRSGRARATFALPGEPKEVSRLLVHGDDVLIERNGGGPLLRLGGVDGKPSEPPTEVQGIPTRDGASLLSAGITSEDEGRAWVTLAGKDATHKWTRELRFPAALTAVAFADSEASGTIWVVLLAGSTPAEYLNWAVCLDPATGKMRGSFTITPEMPAWQSFRDYAVKDGEGLVYATRDESGVHFSSYRCP